MSERIKNYKRRSISIPIELDANFEIKDLLYEIKNEIKNIEMNKGFNGS